MKFTRFGKMVCVGLLAVTTAIGSMCMASAATNTNTGEKAEYFQYGDVNMDGRVSVIDRTMIQKFIVGMETPTKEQERLADVDGDGVISIKDSTDIGKYLVRLKCSPKTGTVSNVKLTYALYGDVNRDGVISATDATAIFVHLNGGKRLNILQKQLADVDGDGKVTKEDAVHIQEYIVRLYTNDIIGTESDVPVII